MNTRYLILSLLLIVYGCFRSYGQDSAASVKPAVSTRVYPHTVNPFLPDSAAKTIKHTSVADSIAMFYLMPDSAKMRASFVDSILKAPVTGDFFLGRLTPKKSAGVPVGNPRNTRDIWVIGVVAFLLFYTGLLNLFFNGDMQRVTQSFFNKHSISQSDKEGGLINSWAFVGLILLFCFTSGLILYELTRYYDVPHPVNGFQLFLLLSGIAALLVTLKFVLLKFVGFVFDISALVSGYIAVLNLTYFSLALLMLAVLVCFALLGNQFMHGLLRVGLGAAIIIFFWQYVRNCLGVISGFRFHKFYLFVYLCALEICPVLILVKALNL